MSHDGVDFCELVPPEMSLNPALEQSVVYASDLELGETVTLVMEAVRESAPQRVVFDSFSEIRLLAQSSLRFRRQVLALKHFFAQAGCTVLALDDVTAEDDDVNLHSLAHGVIRLEQVAVDYGNDRRRLRVLKMRARPFVGGYHDYLIATGGLAIFPRMIATNHSESVIERTDRASSGLAPLDMMIGGGLDWRTSTLIMGPSGVGKSTLSMRFAQAAIERGERVLYISFDESTRNLKRRCTGLGFDLEQPEADGLLVIRSLDPAELTPGELTDFIRDQVASSTLEREMAQRLEAELRLRTVQGQLIHVSRLNAMNTLGSAIAHELNQPLAAILNYMRGAERLLGRVPDVPEDLLDAVRAAAGNAHRAGLVIRRLRDLVQHQPVARRPGSLDAMAGEARALALINSPLRAVECRIDIPAAADGVIVDAIQIQQVLINLIRNAADAMEHSPERVITVAARQISAGRVQVAVTDTGPGVPADFVIEQVAPFRSSKPEGLGIGLSICRTIIEDHGGKLQVANGATGGAVVSFDLPGRDSEEHAPV